VSNPNTPDPLDELLQGLPRVEASDGFTGRVLAGLEGRPRRTTRSGTVGWAVAAALLLVALLVGGLRVEQQHAAGERATRAAALRSEHESLQQDLARLRSLAETERPVVYLGGTDQVDLVLDLTSVERPVPLAPALPLDPRLATETRTQ
jgi:hypothetical protein